MERVAGGTPGSATHHRDLILMVAGRGIAQLVTNGQIVTVYYAPYFYIGNGFLLGLPFALFVRLRCMC